MGLTVTSRTTVRSRFFRSACVVVAACHTAGRSVANARIRARSPSESSIASCRRTSWYSRSSPTSAALAPLSRPAPPHPPPPRSGRLAARPDPGGVTRAGAPPGPGAPLPHPSARSLTASPRRRRMAQGSRAIAGPGLAFSPFSPSRRRRGASSGAGPGSSGGRSVRRPAENGVCTGYAPPPAARRRPRCPRVPAVGAALRRPRAP
jgi:hypothetical protein